MRGMPPGPPGRLSYRRSGCPRPTWEWPPSKRRRRRGRGLRQPPPASAHLPPALAPALVSEPVRPARPVSEAQTVTPARTWPPALAAPTWPCRITTWWPGHTAHPGRPRRQPRPPPSPSSRWRRGPGCHRRLRLGRLAQYPRSRCPLNPCRPSPCRPNQWQPVRPRPGRRELSGLAATSPMAPARRTGTFSARNRGPGCAPTDGSRRSRSSGRPTPSGRLGGNRAIQRWVRRGPCNVARSLY
jgi:hypothetical protein